MAGMFAGLNDGAFPQQQSNNKAAATKPAPIVSVPKTTTKPAAAKAAPMTSAPKKK